MPRLPKFTLVLKLIKVKNGSGGGGEYREAGISSSHEKAVLVWFSVSYAFIFA